MRSIKYSVKEISGTLGLNFSCLIRRQGHDTKHLPFGKLRANLIDSNFNPSTPVSPLPSHTLFFIVKMFRRYVYRPIGAISVVATCPNWPIELTMPPTQRPSKIGRPGFKERLQTSSLYWLKSCLCALCE